MRKKKEQLVPSFLFTERKLYTDIATEDESQEVERQAFSTPYNTSLTPSRLQDIHDQHGKKFYQEKLTDAF